MPRILAPSDISILEEKYSVGKRPLTIFERIGCMLTPPMLHVNYTKNDKKDKRRILTKRYNSSSSDKSGNPRLSHTDEDVLDIVCRRQESIRKQVLSGNFSIGGMAANAMLTSYLIRHYDLKTKSIVVPLSAFAGFYIGKATGDLFLGRWREYARDRALGELPPKQYISGSERR